jgi:cytochrome c oxidase cbb3-type subunit 2
MIIWTLRIVWWVVLEITATQGIVFCAESLARGKLVFEKNCAVCHGTGGDGAGPEAQRFFTRPADLQRGIFKFRSTPSGSMPTDQDLRRTIWRGLPGSGMVSQEHLRQSEIKDVIAYLKIFSRRWREVPPERSLPIVPPKNRLLLATKGAEIFKKAGCPECHGEQGRGDGPSAASLTSQGRPTRPADLTRRPLKGGDQPADIYRILLTGMDGTPMPSYRDALDQDDMWALGSYVSNLASPNILSPPTDDERIGWEIEIRHQNRHPPR